MRFDLLIKGVKSSIRQRFGGRMDMQSTRIGLRR
jgi:hypothetical protein